MIRIDRLPIGSLADSNVYLRSLWAVLRARFGRLGWEYSPRKNGRSKRIRFGWMTLGAMPPAGVEVIVQYERKGVIKAIEFEFRGKIDEIYSEIEGTLRDAVQEAVVSMYKPNDFHCVTQVVTLPAIPLGNYQRMEWYSCPLDNGNTEIGMNVRAFDEVDAQNQFTIHLISLMDVLSCMTNVVFVRLEESEGKARGEQRGESLFLDNPDWLDGTSAMEGQLRLTADQLSFCDDVINEETADDRLLRAAHMFHKALTLMHKVPECYDVATALFISALEVVDMPLSSPSTCEKCGQPMYKISRRVVELGTRHLGPNVKKIFRDHYNRRSKYLHNGQLFSSQFMGTHILPQLDPDGVEGCAMPSAMGSPVNLMEFSSFVIRREMLLNTEAARALAVQEK